MTVIGTTISLLAKYKKAFQLGLGIIVAVLITVMETQAQDTRGFIYGKVYTRDNTYQGQLRWGKEEAYWNDHFNVSKVAGQQYEHLRKDSNDENSWLDFDWNFLSIWENKVGNTHQFTVQFGDLKTIKSYSRKSAVLELKNGSKIRVSGSGYNDLEPRLRILDDEIGEISLKWEVVDKVEFLPTPNNLRPNFGKPLYGTVQVYRKGSFTGFIQWDHDERLGNDKLDGDNRDGNASIRFESIRSIESGRGGSTVELHGGRSFFLTGSNDVNSGNRGIIVTVEGVGKIDIPWKVFDNVVFEKDYKSSGPGYSSYRPPKGLSGTVITYENNRYQGRIVYDLDEAMDIEFLEGKDDELEYRIPFRNVKRIRPKNYNYSQVELKNGQELILGDGRDVSDRNDGVLVFQRGKKDPEYISWKNVSEIVFD